MKNKTSFKLKLQMLLQNWVFVILFIILIFLLGVIANKYEFSNPGGGDNKSMPSEKIRK